MKPTSTVAAVSFGSDDLYSGSVFIPEGNYCCFFDFVKDTGKDGKRKDASTAVKVTFHSLENPAAEALTKNYGIGAKASESYLPHPDNSKMLAQIPGSAGGTFSNKSNWALFRDAFRQSGLPNGVLDNDLSVIDGVWLTIQHVDEPTDRKDIGKNVNKLAEDGGGGNNTPYTPGKIPVPSDIVEGGAPWEGGGGLPAADAVKSTAKAGVKPAPAAAKVAATKAAPKAVKTATMDDAELLEAGLTYVLADDKFSESVSTLVLKNEGFKRVSAELGDENAQQWMTLSKDADALAIALEGLGYEIKGTKVVKA